MNLIPSSGTFDCNSVTKACAYQISASEMGRVTNAPTGATDGILWVPFYKEGYWRFQIFAAQSANEVWYRCGASSSWGVWKKVPNQ